MMQKMSIRNLPLEGKRVLLRVDFNTPLNQDGSVADDSRIKAALPTIEYVLHHKGKVILMSHLGRPQGRPSDFQRLSLSVIHTRLAEFLKKTVHFSSDAIGPEAEKKVACLQNGEVLLLENVRFHPGEEDPAKEAHFAGSLAKLGDVYVNDAFSSAHRAHGSTALIASFFPHSSAMGLLMEREIKALSSLLHHPKHPFFVVMGGAKISTKIGVIENLLKTVDQLYIGGGMAYPFLKAKNLEIGDSVLEPGSEEIARKILESAREKIQLPLDVVIANGFSQEAQIKTVSVQPGIVEGIPAGWQGMDIGPQTIRHWSQEFKKAKTLFWNGPVGVYEMEKFMHGTREIALALSSSQANVIIGGGDSAAAVAKLGLENAFSHISMGGGATLEYLEFGHLPGIDCLTNAPI